MVRVVPEADVDRVLSVEECIPAIEKLHKRLAAGEAMTDLMETILTPVSDPPEGTTSPVYHGLRTMDGAIYYEDVASVRISSDIIHWPRKEGERVRQKIPATDDQYNGLVLLFDTNAGELLGIFPDAIIQHLRVGASSALAAKYLANNDADQLGVLGAGWQAQSHIPALDQIFDLETVTVYSPTPESRQSFAETMDEEIDAEVIPASEAKAVFKDADIVQCVTNSTEPVFDMDWVEDGTHVTIIRLAEAPKTFFDLDNLDAFATNWPPNVTQHEMYGNNLRENEKNAWVWNNYAIETDEPIPKLEWFDEVESLIEWDKISTLAEVIGGDVEGRTDHTEITGFFTCAVGVDFTAVAKLLYDVSEQKDLGRKLPAELFTQSHHP